MHWLGTDGTFATTFALRPDLHVAWQQFREVFWQRELLDPVLLELCRLRVASLHGCAAELEARTPQARDAGLTETRIQAVLEDRPDAASPGERACLRFAEQFVLDPHGITDAEAGAVREALGDAGTVALTEALALFDGFCRFRTTLALDGAGVGEPD